MYLPKFVAVLALGFVPFAAHASTISPFSGQFSITGSSIADNGSSLTFTPSTIVVGAANTISGSFLNLLTAGESGTITSPINYMTYNTMNPAQIVFGNGAVDFTIASLTEVTSANNMPNFAIFTGTGLLTSTTAGYAATPATLTFSTQGNGDTTFSATVDTISAVPEPSTLAMLGTGLVGIAGIAKRRFLA